MKLLVPIQIAAVVFAKMVRPSSYLGRRGREEVD